MELLGPASFGGRRSPARGLRRRFAYLALGCAASLGSYAGTTSYVYDVHGRLKTVITPNGSDETITHNVYDDAGNRVSVISFLASTPPDPPTGVIATAVASDQIEVNWTPSLDAGGGAVSYYRVYRGGQLLASPTVPPLADASVLPNTTYSYRVSAVDAVGHESAQSVAANATTPPDSTEPTAPANLSGTAVSDTQVNLGWSASEDLGGSGLAGYEILRGAGDTPIGTSSSTSFSDQSASSGTTYSYRVRAYDGAGNRSDDSNQIWVTTPDTVAPGAPGSPTFSSVTLETAVADWSAASDNVAVTGYRYSLNGGGSGRKSQTSPPRSFRGFNMQRPTRCGFRRGTRPAIGARAAAAHSRPQAATS